MRLLLLGCLMLAVAGAAQARSHTDVRQRIIQESIRSHGGHCVCPWQMDGKGPKARLCGRRSLYNKPGGYPPQCYARDVDDDSVDAWLNEHEHPSR